MGSAVHLFHDMCRSLGIRTLLVYSVLCDGHGTLWLRVVLRSHLLGRVTRGQIAGKTDPGRQRDLCTGNHQHHPSDEISEMAILELGAIVNCRPITCIPMDSPKQESLMPNHFLLFGTKRSRATGNSNQHWHLAQSLVDYIWNR